MPETTPIESRKEAIASAVAALPNVPPIEEEKVETTKVESKSTAAAAEVDDTKKDEKVAADAEAALAEQGKQLIQALNDPTKAPIVIKFLAEQAGYVKPPETKTEAKEIKDAILEKLRTHLSDKNSSLDMSFLADKLAPAIKEILSEELAKSQEDIRTEIESQQLEKLKNQGAVALERLSDDFFGEKEVPANVNTEMSKYMDRVAPSADMSPKEYLEDAFHFAIGKLGITKDSKKSQARASANRTDAASRLASARVAAESNLKVDNTKPPTRKDAIRMALESLEEKE